MCLNQKCELKEKCFRFIAEPNPYRQAYEKFPHQDNYDDCFIDIKEKSHYAIRRSP
jgi:hypothetical protein